MNDIIDRLRDATRATGETIDTIRPLELEAGRSRMNWVVPVAAAAAVTVAIAGGSMFVAGGGLDLAAAPAVPPKFLVDSRAGVVVRAVAGGAETDRLADPAEGEQFTAIQAAHDNRTFYLASTTQRCGSNLYKFSLDDNGKIVGFGTAPIAPPAGHQVVSLAVSGDGAKLAYGLQPCVPSEVGGKLVVADTVTGESKTWKSPEGYGVLDLSLNADGSRVAFRRSPPSIAFVAEAPMVVPSGSAIPTPYATISIDPGQIQPLPMPSAGASGPYNTIAPVPADTLPWTMTPPPGVQVVPPEPTATVTLPPAAAVASPMPTITETFVPAPDVTATAVIPPLPTPIPSWDGIVQSFPSGLSSCRYMTLPRTSTQYMCADPPIVQVIDTNDPGTNLDQGNTVVLPNAYEGLSGGLFGLQLSPDGSQLISALGFSGLEMVDGVIRQKSGESGIVAFSAENGQPEEVLYRTAGNSLAMLLDLDGTGENPLIQQGDDIGGIMDGEFRPLIKGDANLIPKFGTELAW
ncbi:hypothetical protein Acor_74850 [Acrocarpospora corrugata]|uniref:Uncharacterized protein n=1 Tax=Acrocarpospora corrugata TaxID=35763 RepID=A0A5M3W8L6_9ACTN|nr:hypothetical protein [Acrocarpospora corrugata]GES05417.1 hypothetical protein Acor_74850 [Acrocarpospora corrugata]